MSFCEHCLGQRFDRAQVLRTLRSLRRTLDGRPRSRAAAAAVDEAIRAVRRLDIPHLEQMDDEIAEGEIVH